ncbi:MAG: transcriptional regulator, partial [Cryomorphaceae bacterium]|nr:transcriptional regulator [Cryomorphaceae bacterium]
VYFFSYWDVTGVGNEKIGKVYRGITYSTKDIQRRCLSIIVSDTFVDATVEAIIKSGATGSIGDGKIFVLPCDEAYRIRTGEQGTKSFN